MNDGHPTDQQLSQFARFELNIEHAELVKEHLSTCSECNAKYRQTHQMRPGAPRVTLAKGKAQTQVA